MNSENNCIWGESGVRFAIRAGANGSLLLFISAQLAKWPGRPYSQSRGWTRSSRSLLGGVRCQFAVDWWLDVRSGVHFGVSSGERRRNRGSPFIAVTKYRSGRGAPRWTEMLRWTEPSPTKRHLRPGQISLKLDGSFVRWTHVIHRYEDTPWHLSQVCRWQAELLSINLDRGWL